MCRYRRELSFRTDSYSNEYLLAKIGVDTAENEPLKVWRKLNSLFIRLLIQERAASCAAGVTNTRTPIPAPRTPLCVKQAALGSSRTSRSARGTTCDEPGLAGAVGSHVVGSQFFFRKHACILTGVLLSLRKVLEWRSEWLV